MRNPFNKYKKQYEEVEDLLWDLSLAVAMLRGEVQEIREEVNYLIHFAEEAEDSDD